jgi:hypothetical protein
MSGILQACCCGAEGACVKDCIWQTEIDSGCCHKEDTLLLWCERPGYSIRTNAGCYKSGGTSFDEFCCIRSQPSEEPIQAIYHYDSCWFRCVKMTSLGLAGYDGLAEMCPPSSCEIDPISGLPTACASYLSTACNSFPPCSFPQNGCCNDPNWNGQPWSKNCITCCDTCNDEGMSIWRRARMSVTDRWKWLVEAICHKNGQNLGSGGDCDLIGGYSNCDRLGGLNRANQVLCVVHFERWWKIAETCPEGARIYIPNDPGTCNTSQLVPKWWIFACSGIPLYAGDLIDATRFGVITGAEALQILTDLATACAHPSQAVLKKLSDAGYIRANDWRDEQKAAYQELNVRFPGAGYAGCITKVENMNPLGPFRKRMTYKTVGTSLQPLLRKGDVVSNPDLAPLQASCFIDYPGSTLNQADYDYWCERQWVYFRGRPGGWTWADWNATLCSGDEKLSILLGDTRGSANCIGALTGSCRTAGTATACSCCNTTSSLGVTVNCRGCDTYDCDLPLGNCGPPDICQSLSAQPYCEGLHFKYFLYAADNELKSPDMSVCAPGPECKLCTKISCKMTLESYLVGAKRSVDSWLDSVPFTCRTESPPLPVFNSWAMWSKSHPAPQSSICNPAITPGSDSDSWCWGCGCLTPCPSSEYTGRMCCGAMCLDFECDCDPTTVDPYTGPQATPCSSGSDCPPHANANQIACIGHSITCS